MIYLIRHGETLRPLGMRDFEWLNKLGDGEIAMLKPQSVANPYLFRKMWSAMRWLWDNQETHMPSVEMLKDRLLIEAGKCTTVILADGQVNYVPFSIKPDLMSESEMNELYQSITQVICDKWDLDKQQLDKFSELY